MPGTPSLSDEDFCVAVSWVLYSIREVMGLADIRREVLHALLPTSTRGLVELGETFGSESKPEDLTSYLKATTTTQARPQKLERRYLVFSGINRAQHGETHYQGFIVDRAEKKIYIADPAWLGTQPGIYKPFLAQQQVIPFYSARGYASEFIRTTHPCQTSTDDVFCQSWTLYLMMEFLKRKVSNASPIPIPPSTIRRYGILLKFYRSVLERVPQASEDLHSTYLYHIGRHRSLVVGISSPNERKTRRDIFRSVDPIRLLTKDMKPSDMEDCGE